MNIEPQSCSEPAPPIVRRTQAIVELSIVLGVLTVVGYCAWSLNRGFEISDEAYYVLLAMRPRSAEFFISAQQWITAPLWDATGSLVRFRAAGLVILLASSTILAIGVWSKCIASGPIAQGLRAKLVVVAGSASGALLYASTINLSPCYNLLAAAGAYAAVGMFLIATSGANGIRRYAWFAGAGCAIGIETLCKASAGVATLAILLVWTAVFGLSSRDRILGATTIIAASITTAVASLLANTTIAESVPSLQQGMLLFKLVQGEPVVSRLARNATELALDSLIAVVAFAGPLAALGAYAKTRRAILVQIALLALAVTLILGHLEVREVHGRYLALPFFSTRDFGSNYLFGGFNRYLVETVAALAMLIMVLILSTTVWKRSRAAFALFAGLIVLPYSVAIGSGNPLFTQIVDSMAFWGVVVGVLAVARPLSSYAGLSTRLVGLCFFGTLGLHVVTSNMRPYHMVTPLRGQNQPVVVGDVGTVKVDAETSIFLAALRGAATECGIPPGAPFLGLYDSPGVALALRAVPIGTPWLGNHSQAEFVMHRTSPEKLRTAIVAINMAPDRITPALPPQLAGFPAGYRFCGEATFPFGKRIIQIWQPVATRLVP